MRLTSSKYTRPHRLNSGQWRRILIASIGLTLIVSVIPWAELTTTSAGVAIALIAMAGLIIWLQLRVTKLESIVSRLDSQARRLSAQAKTSPSISPQSVSHIDTKRFFGDKQTKH